MLLYWNRSYVRLMMRSSGSIFLRADLLGGGFFLAGVSMFLQYLINIDSEFAPRLPHHYGIHAIGVVVAFAVVFRTNLGWQRYWEAISQLHFMYSKWSDAYAQLFAFASVTVEQLNAKGDDLGKIERVCTSLSNIQKYMCIMSAVTADRLTHGDTQRMEVRASKVPWNKQIALRRDIRKEDLTGATKMPVFEEIRPSKGSRTLSKQALDSAWHMCYIVRSNPNVLEHQALEDCSDRPTVVMYWIINELAKVAGDLVTAPPIQSRMYQELSNGMIGFANCLKIADVPFPFPYAQLLAYVLVVYSCLIPIYITAFTQSMVLSAVLTFLLFEGIWGVNEVAKELENPFGPDMNDISMADFHARFIEGLEDIDIAYQAVAPRSTPPDIMHRQSEPFESDSRPSGRDSLAQSKEAVQSYWINRRNKKPTAADEPSTQTGEGAAASSVAASSVGHVGGPSLPLPEIAGTSEAISGNTCIWQEVSPRGSPEAVLDSIIQPQLPVAATEGKLLRGSYTHVASEIICREGSRDSRDVEQSELTRKLMEMIDSHLTLMSTSLDKNLAQMSRDIDVFASAARLQVRRQRAI